MEIDGVVHGIEAGEGDQDQRHREDEGDGVEDGAPAVPPQVAQGQGGGEGQLLQEGQYLIQVPAMMAGGAGAAVLPFQHLGRRQPEQVDQGDAPRRDADDQGYRAPQDGGCPVHTRRHQRDAQALGVHGGHLAGQEIARQDAQEGPGYPDHAGVSQVVPGYLLRLHAVGHHGPHRLALAEDQAGDDHVQAEGRDDEEGMGKNSDSSLKLCTSRSSSSRAGCSAPSAP